MTEVPPVCLLAFLTALVVTLLTAAPAQAHVRTTSVAVDLRGQGDGVTAVVDVEYDPLARLLGLDAKCPDRYPRDRTQQAHRLAAVFHK
jgi:hypothetical protein